MSEVEEYMEDALGKLLDPDTCEDSLHRLDSLLGQLCILSNQMNLHSTSKTLNNKSFISKTQKPILKVWKVPTVDDLVFGEFIGLQERFQYNITSHIIQLLDKQTQYTDDILILANQVLQGCLLLHPPSRDLFRRKSNMTLLLRYLTDFENYSAKLITTIIQSLVCLMVRNVANLRNFEVLNGPQFICQIFNTTTEKTVKYKSLEFLMFYLIPETVAPIENLFEPSSTTSTTTSSTFSAFSTTSSFTTLESLQSGGSSKPSSKDSFTRRTMAQKLDILKPYLDNVDELMNQLIEIKPFGKMRNIDW